MDWNWFYIGNRPQKTKPNQILGKHPSVSVADCSRNLAVIGTVDVTVRATVVVAVAVIGTASVTGTGTVPEIAVTVTLTVTIAVTTASPPPTRLFPCRYFFPCQEPSGQKANAQPRQCLHRGSRRRYEYVRVIASVLSSLPSDTPPPPLEIPFKMPPFSFLDMYFLFAAQYLGNLFWLFVFPFRFRPVTIKGKKRHKFGGK